MKTIIGVGGNEPFDLARRKSGVQRMVRRPVLHKSVSVRRQEWREQQERRLELERQVMATLIVCELVALIFFVVL